jgi:diguanylate cyclase (GGDEF)-like protein/PAS domain S-box-containing protein
MARARRWVACAAALWLVLMTGSVLLISQGEAQERRVLTERFDARQATAARFIDAYVGEVFQREATLGARLFAGSISGQAFAQAAGDQGFDAAVLLDASGRILASQPANPRAVGRDLTVDYGSIRSAVGGMPAVSGVVPSSGRGAPVVAFAMPFQTSQGARIFSGAYAVQDTPLAPFVNNATPFHSGRVFVVDAAGLVVAGNAPDSAGRLLADVDPQLALVTADSGYVGAGSDRQYVSQSGVPGTTWHLVFGVKTDELFASLQTAGRWIPWVAWAGSGLLGLLSLALFYRYLVQRARLIESEGRRRTILDGAGEGFVGMDEHGTITDWNAAATRLLGWTGTEAIGRTLDELIIPPEQRDAHRSAVARFLSTGRTSLPASGVRVQAVRRCGTRVDVEFSLSRMEWGTGWHFHAFLRDITDQLAHESQLRTLALTDSLTGLANHRSALDRLDAALSRARRQGHPVTVLFIDVDHFKAVNDGHGHAAGDQILIDVAARLRADFRTEDILARVGGDEFLVICENLATVNAAEAVAARTRATLAQPYVLADRTLRVTASIGLAFSDGTITAEALLAHADAKMYDAKAIRQAFAEIVVPVLS